MNHTLQRAVPLLALSLAPLLAANATPPEPGAAPSALAPYHSAPPAASAPHARHSTKGGHQ